MPINEQLALTEKDQEKLEAIRVEMGFSSIEEAAEFLIKRALRKRVTDKFGRASSASCIFPGYQVKERS